MSNFEHIKYLNNFSIKTSAAISADVGQVIPYTLNDANFNAFILTITNDDSSQIEIIEVEYLDDVDYYGDGGGVSGFLIKARGLQGTIAKEWPDGSSVYCSLTAGFANDAVSSIFDVDVRLTALESRATIDEYKGRIQINFLFDTPRDGTLDRIGEIIKEDYVGDESWPPDTMATMSAPLNIFELVSFDSFDYFELRGPKVRRARIVSSEGYGSQSVSAHTQFLKISVLGAHTSYVGACEAAMPATIQIVQDGIVLGEERVEWPAKGLIAEYHIEYQFY